MIIGTTYSHRHSRHYRLDPKRSFTELLEMRPGSIRLACYWEEIETVRGKYDFSEVQNLLDMAERRKQKIVLVVGMKGPRFPEFFFPKWLTEQTPEGAEPYIFDFVEKTIEILRKYRSITHWQVENEPFYRSGRINRAIPLSILKKEIEIVRKKDRRPILITLWGNGFFLERDIWRAAELADVIGLDLYYKIPVFGPIYRGPWIRQKTLKDVIQKVGKPLWITELQAEPWERRYFFKQDSSTPSMNQDILRQNFEKVRELRPKAVFLWGTEYWLMKKIRGEPDMWHTASEIMGGTYG